jgi:hypothetical protein
VKNYLSHPYYTKRQRNFGGQIAEDDTGPALLFTVELFNDAVSVAFIIRAKGMWKG